MVRRGGLIGLMFAACGGSSTHPATPEVKHPTIVVDDAPKPTLTGPGQPPHIEQLSLGAHHSCSRWSDGHVECWGEGKRGVLGDGTTDVRLTPGRVANVDRATSICSGDFYACALVEDGTVKCWGSNNSGQLGDGTTEMRATPVAVVDLSDVAELACGDVHACARTKKSGVRCWGGQLGDNGPGDRGTPGAVVQLSDAIDIAAGWAHTCARRPNDAVSCWGHNQQGQLGDGTTKRKLVPTPMASAATSTSNAMPPIDDQCATDADCTTTGLFGTCCGGCEQRYASQSYVTRAQAYCAAHPPPSCPPTGCSWGMAKAHCITGRCQAAKP